MIPKTTAKHNFIHGYCRTCHSYQGSSIDDNIIIFDWNFIHVNRKWIYTTVTRATELSKVIFYNGKSEDFNNTLLNKYLKDKIEGYKQQDTRANRTCNIDNYVHIKWLVKCFQKSCTNCGA